MADNPMDYLKQLEQMGEQIRQMFGNQDFMKKMMPQMPNFMNPAQGVGATGPNVPGFDWNREQYPRVDLYETLKDLIAIVEVPGLQSASDVRISVEPSRLNIKGFVGQSYDNTQRDRMHLSERHRGAFDRAVTLPVPVLPDEVRAAYKHGLLEITMAKDQRQPDQSNGRAVPVDF